MPLLLMTEPWEVHEMGRVGPTGVWPISSVMDSGSCVGGVVL